MEQDANPRAANIATRNPLIILSVLVFITLLYSIIRGLVKKLFVNIN